MYSKNFITRIISIIGLGYTIIATASLVRQNQMLQEIVIPETRYAVKMGIAKFPAHSSTGRHMNSGVEVGYVLEGEITLTVAGQSTTRIKAGESFQTPAYIIHDIKAGPQGAKVLATWVTERGKPIFLPVT
jgi:quercetin dioxygenase-like cupin family protein